MTEGGREVTRGGKEGRWRGGRRMEKETDGERERGMVLDLYYQMGAVKATQGQGKGKKNEFKQNLSIQK